jgi:hypothetical protein
VLGLRDVELDSWLLYSETVRGWSSCEPKAAGGMLDWAVEWPVGAGSVARCCFFLLDVLQTNYSLLMCSLTMCTSSVVSC